MSRQQTWVDGRVDVLLAALHTLGLSGSRVAAAELIHERVRWVSSQAGISPAAARRYLTDEALAPLAQTMAFSRVEETPGADLLDAPRTAGVPLPLIGRCIAGLAEAVQVRLHELDDLDHIRVTVARLAHALSELGQLTADGPDGGHPRPGRSVGRHPSPRRHQPALFADDTAHLHPRLEGNPHPIPPCRCPTRAAAGPTNPSRPARRPASPPAPGGGTAKTSTKTRRRWPRAT